jgi:hypothetical protein
MSEDEPWFLSMRDIGEDRDIEHALMLANNNPQRK